jgi:signal peptide peptidase SppA
MSLNREILSLFTRSPLWAIRPDAIAALLAGNLDTRAERPKTRSVGARPHKVAVIPVQGVLTKDGPAWLGSNYDGITEAAEQAAADPSVKHIVLAVDSPGGDVVGLPETAEALRSVAKVKPVTAMVDGMAASAAYWLTAQARDIHLTPSGEVGSVGVRMMHVDMSKALTDAGLNVTELSSGKYKTEWSPYHALSDDARADMQERLDTVHGTFLNYINSGRGSRATRQARETRFGEGRMFTAKDALAHGLVDRVQPTREFFKAVTQEPREVTALTPHRLQLALARARFAG